MWLDYKKIKPAFLTPSLKTLWQHLGGTTPLGDDTLQRDFLEILTGIGSKFRLVKNPHLLDCLDPLTIKWHSNTSVLELVDSFYGQAEKQREQDIAFALEARSKAMNAVEAARQAAMHNNVSASDFNNIISTTVNAAAAILFGNTSGGTPQIPTIPPPYRRPSIAETLEATYALSWTNASATPPTTTMEGAILNYINFIIRQLHMGKQPSLQRNFEGTLCVKYTQIHTMVSGERHGQPRLFILNHYKTATYDGLYGMSCVVKTLSLNPDERTTITIKSYKNSTHTRSRAENILDSFSEASSKEFTDSFNNEIMNKQTKSTDWGVNGKVESTETIKLTIPLDEVKAEVGGMNTGSLSGDYKVHDGHEEVVKTVRNTFEKHTSNSSHDGKWR